jgi:hypothetical protein
VIVGVGGLVVEQLPVEEVLLGVGDCHGAVVVLCLLELVAQLRVDVEVVLNI